jgi:hypothetical protein
MAIQTTAVVRAQCDACPQVVYADSPAQPKGYQLHAREVDGNGREVNVEAFACQPNHVGKAIANAIKAAKAGVRQQISTPAYAPTAVTFPAPAAVPAPEIAPWDQDEDSDPEAAQG